MSGLEIAGATRMEHRSREDRKAPFLCEANLALSSFSRTKPSKRWRSMHTPRRFADITEEVVQRQPDVPRQADASLNKLEEVHSNIHTVSQANALIRQRVLGRVQTAALTRENLMMLEDDFETNRPAEQMKRKKEFIQKEMEKGRRSSGPSEEKLALLRKISEREEKTAAAQKHIRSDSVLGDLRKARFRMVAQMAQKRLQSVSPDVNRMIEEGKLATQLDWYLRFCGEENAVDEEKEEDSDLSN